MSAADLQTYITANEPTPTLAALTRFGEADVTTINTTVLLEYCTQAIRTFEKDYTDYDPTNYPSHQDVARLLVMRALYQRTNDYGMVQSINEDLKSITADLMRRGFLPVSDSPYIPSTPVQGSKPPWDRTVFEDYRID